ncbi:P-loop containing nucleoside triphosphate hydrolase protein [Cytidiella melzeri]|nr:P-loop containing nucleoside triphosphate hydrolase protein [Cytidiella melzeri]
MSLTSSHTISIPESGDELDCLTPSSVTVMSSGATTPTLYDSEQTTTPTSATRTLRKRRLTKAESLTKFKIVSQSKRKRTLFDFEGFDAKPQLEEEVAAKKAKTREDKKAHTIVINHKKVAIDAARRRWLHRHRDLFTPLLPPLNSFFEGLEKEIIASVDRGSYKPLREILEQPKLIQNGTLKDYQLRGLSFLAHMYDNGMNCILGDEMGLGKTLQTLSLFAYVHETSKGSVDPHLIICPLSVVDTWIREITHWLPSFRSFRFHAHESERARLKQSVRNGEAEFDICVTTYEGFSAEDSWLKSRRWTYVVLDEGHKVKNSETQIAHKVQGIGSLYRLILTGTPVQNNLVELWGLLHWLYPAVFGTATEKLFHDAFNLSQGTYALPFLSATEKLLSKIMLRRTKEVVEGQLSIPPREELTVFIPMTDAQRFWTYRLLTRLDTLDLEEVFASDGETLSGGRLEVQRHIEAHNREHKVEGGASNQWKRLMNLLIQLRQVCDHPYLLPDVQPDPYVNGEHVVASSAKLVLVDKLLKDILPKGDRVLIFSQFTGMLDLLEDFMALRSIPYVRLDGSTPRPRRTLNIKLFQQEKSPYQVFLISTKAGGLGINLTKASHVIMFDSDWNPQNDLQAIARAHRIGQTQVVKVYRLICQGSVEDQMLDRIRRKLFLSMKVMNSHTSVSSSDDEQNVTLQRNELMSILRKGSSAISGVENGGLTLGEFLAAPIESVLRASRSHDDVRATRMKKEVGEEIKGEEEEKLLVSAEEEEQRLLQGVAQVHSRLFEGRVVNKRSNKETAEEWREVQKRARKNRIVVVDGYEVLAEHLGPEVVSVGEFSLPCSAAD